MRATPNRSAHSRSVLRIAVVLGVAVGLAGLDGCTRTPHTAALHDVAATVRRFPIDSDQYVLVPDSLPDVRYVPDDLPAALREDGLAVVFDAELLPVPANVRLVGPPIRVLAIRPRNTPRS